MQNALADLLQLSTIGCYYRIILKYGYLKAIKSSNKCVFYFVSMVAIKNLGVLSDDSLNSITVDYRDLI